MGWLAAVVCDMGLSLVFTGLGISGQLEHSSYTRTHTYTHNKCADYT
jgi:hypothetical protein